MLLCLLAAKGSILSEENKWEVLGRGWKGGLLSEASGVAIHVLGLSICLSVHPSNPGTHSSSKSIELKTFDVPLPFMLRKQTNRLAFYHDRNFSSEKKLHLSSVNHKRNFFFYLYCSFLVVCRTDDKMKGREFKRNDIMF